MLVGQGPSFLDRGYSPPCWDTATALDIWLDEVCERNIEKLKNLYPECFSAEKSQHRQAGYV